MELFEVIRKKFSEMTPLLVSADDGSLKLEMKPYLQPFEKLLAIKELKALLQSEVILIEEQGYYIVNTDVSEDILLNKLTFWQRLGREYLVPTLQKLLEFTQNGFEKTTGQTELHNTRRLRYGPHDLHEYRGKFFPQLVKSLINIAGIPDNSIILDPMSGSGTAPCECVAAGYSTLGADLNPLSVLISSVKCELVLENPNEFKNNVDLYIKNFDFRTRNQSSPWNQNDSDYLSRWFSDKAITDIAWILKNVNSISNVVYRNFFRVCLSNIIRSVSWQKETDLRVRKEIKDYTEGFAIEKFLEEISRQFDKIYSYLCIIPFKESKPFFSIREGNSVDISNVFTEYINKVDLLITSPPYATALPYLDTDRLSLIVLGLLPHKAHKLTEIQMVGTREVSEYQRKEIWDYYLSRRAVLPQNVQDLINLISNYNHGENIGFRRRNLPALLGKYFLEMYDAMKSAHSLMKQGSSGFYIVGNNSTTVNATKINIPTDHFLFDIGEATGWIKKEFISMELLSSRDIFRENRGSTETILHFTA